MFRIFLGLAGFGLAAYVGEGVLGYLASGQPERLNEHVLAGLAVGIYLCGLHTVTMFHLIGTAKETKEAAKELPEYSDIVSAIRESKMRVFPIITFTLVASIATVVLGGAIDNRVLPLWVHHVTTAATFALNAWTFWLEYNAVKVNFLLMTLVDFRLEEAPKKPADIQEGESHG